MPAHHTTSDAAKYSDKILENIVPRCKLFRFKGVWGREAGAGAGDRDRGGRLEAGTGAGAGGYCG